MARNKKAGKHPSYKKRNMSEAARKKKQAYDTEFSKSPEQVKKRMETNNERRRLKKKGVNVNGKDVAHTKNGLKLKSIKKNRGSKTDSIGDKRARGKKKS